MILALMRLQGVFLVAAIYFFYVGLGADDDWP
jgi:hypothetical protein